MPESRRQVSERLIVLLVAALQFVNIVDFVMVMPMGQFFAPALGFPSSEVPLVVGTYTGAAAAAGLVGSLFLDRFDRRKALVAVVMGLGAGTAAGALAVNLPTLLVSRVVAGAFGGPATSLSLAVIADVVPPSRRGRAVGTVMTAFSMASILGVPAGLFVAEAASWRAAFFGLGALAMVTAVAAALALPPLKRHLEGPRPSGGGTLQLLARPTVQLSYLMTATVMMGGFAVIPNLPAYAVGNLGASPAMLKWIYFIGGFANFAVLQIGGRLVDRFGAFRIGAMGSAILLFVLWLIFLSAIELPILVGYTMFFVAMGFRNVAHTTLATRVPRPFERARFQSIQSSVQHAATAAGAFVATRLVSPASVDGRQALAGMEAVTYVSMGLTLVLPLLMLFVERGVRRMESALSMAGIPTDVQAPGPSMPSKQEGQASG